MESSSKFRFRDHSLPESQNSSSDLSAVSLSISDRDDEVDIESMTGRGIKHLCDELLELKEAASEDLNKNIFANYSSFLRILEEVIGVENELVQLENHFVSHKRLVKDLTDGIYPKILSINSNFENHIDDDVPSPPSEFEVHINDVSEKLDIFMSENRIDEALDLLESADEHCQSIKLEDYSHSAIMLYNSLISEKKLILIQHLAQIAENTKTAGPELQKALIGLCRLGDTEHAINLLLKHYHLCIVTGTNNLQWSKSSSNELYIRELAKFVFSMISQAAKSFVMLCGENSPYISEFMLWAYEETNSFIACFDKYVKCITTMSDGLSSAIKAVKFAVLYCSLLEKQKLVLRPYLVRHLFPCMEEVLNTHINHLKKVIDIFSASDSWILEKYLVCGVFGGGSSSLAIREQPDYCLLTTSGRKFLTLLQAVIEDISPLVALQMGSLVISGLMNLLTEYIIILERALTSETSTTENAVSSSRTNLAESLPQQVSILANLATLVQFLSIMVQSIFSCTGHMDSHVMENHSIVDQQLQELDDFLLFIEEDSNKLRNVFCQQLIIKVLSTYHSHEKISAIHYNEQFDSNNPMPSVIFQGLFLELRKIEQLEEENVFEVNWLMGLLRELMESMFIWVSNNKEIHATTEENTSLQTDETNQFVLDVQFLVEIGMYGGYFSNDPLLLLTLMKSTFNSAGLDPFKDIDNDEWAIDAATKTIEKLLEIEKTSLHPKDPVVTIKEELHENQINQSAYPCNFSEEDYISSSENADETEAAKEELEVAVDAQTASLVKRDHVDADTLNLRQPNISTMQLENTESEKASDAEDDELASTSSVGEVGQSYEETKSKSDE